MNLFDHRSYVKLKPEKNSGPNGIRTHDLCDTDAVLHRNWAIKSSGSKSEMWVFDLNRIGLCLYNK